MCQWSNFVFLLMFVMTHSDFCISSLIYLEVEPPRPVLSVIPPVIHLSVQWKSFIGRRRRWWLCFFETVPLPLSRRESDTSGSILSQSAGYSRDQMRNKALCMLGSHSAQWICSCWALTGFNGDYRFLLQPKPTARGEETEICSYSYTKYFMSSNLIFNSQKNKSVRTLKPQLIWNLKFPSIHMEYVTVWREYVTDLILQP